MKVEDGNPIRGQAEYDLAVGARRKVLSSSSPSELERAIRHLTFSIMVWSLIQIPAELASATTSKTTLALIAAKSIWTGISAASLLRVSYMRSLFAFLCSVSLVAVTPTLQLEYEQSIQFFVLSLVDCILKALFLICFAIRHEEAK